MTTIVARPNNTHVKSPCALCGVTDREDQIDLYLDGTYDWVCLACARVADPELTDVFEWYWREVCFAVDAHEYDLVNDPITADPTVDPITADQLAHAAQVIADSRAVGGHP